MNTQTETKPSVQGHLSEDFLTKTLSVLLDSPDDFIATKSSIDEAANAIVAKALFDSSRQIDILSMKIKMRALQSVIEIVDKATTKTQLHAMEQTGYNSLFKNGSEIGSMETGVKWDFAACGDEKWNKLNEEKIIAENNLKTRQDFLKSLNEPTILTEGTSPINPPKRTSGKSVFVKFK